MSRHGPGIRHCIVGFVTIWGLAMFSACDAAQEAGGEPESAMPADGRRALELPAAARQQVRAEMRLMLSALNGVLSAISSHDVTAVADAARSGGTAVAVDADPTFADRLPAEFGQLGMETHQRFDALAEAADSGAPFDTLLGRLVRLTANCVACHETYTVAPVIFGP